MSNQSNDNDTETPKQRRGLIATLVDPKSFTILIPVMLSVASAFMLHDRSIHQLQVREDQSNQQIVELKASLEHLKSKVENRRSELVTLQSTVNSNIQQDTQAHNLTREIAILSRTLEQQVKYSINDIKEIKQRLREVEREIDRITK